MSEVKEMLNVPVLQTRIKKDQDGCYLMSNQYVQSVAKYLRNKYRKIRTVKQCDKSDCMKLRIYGFLYQNHFYLYLSKQFDADSVPENIRKLGNIDDMHLQQISNVGWAIARIADKRAEDGKPVFPLISELKSGIIDDLTPWDHFDPNWQHHSKEYNVVDPNNPEDDGMNTADINKARKWCNEDHLWLKSIQYVDYYNFDKRMSRVTDEVLMETRDF